MADLKNLLRRLPDSPGVYRFFNSAGDLIYVGKAKNLKNRVKSYFQKGREPHPKTDRLVEAVTDISWIETNSEVEALTLEANLVREHQPKFNVLLRDDKHFLYLKITKETFPRLLTVRRVEDDGAKYFGPKTDSRATRKTLELVQKLFRVRICSHDLPKRKPEKPCLNFDLNLCSGPCAGEVDKTEYGEQVNAAKKFLAGNTRAVAEELRNKMLTAAEQKSFELAAQLRDKLQAIESLGENQIASLPELADRDTIGLKIEATKTYVALLVVRGGKLIDTRNFVIRCDECDSDEILTKFLTQYFSLSTDFPREILLPAEIDDSELLSDWISEKANFKVKILAPQKGKKESLLRLAEKNAAAFALQNKAKFELASERTIGAAEELAKILDIKKKLHRIEGYDISHHAGDTTVGSMTVLRDGEPANSDYRHFHLRGLADGEIDDPKSLAEVLRRRMSYLETQIPNGYTIRRAKKTDTKNFEFPLFHDFEKEDSEAITSYKNFWVVEYDQKIVGHAKIVDWKNEKLTGLYTVWIDEKHRKKGLASALVREAVRKSKAPKIYLNCTKDLVEFYSRIGFKEIRRVPQFLSENLEKWIAIHPEFSDTRNFLVFDRKSTEIDSSFGSKPDLVILDGGEGQLSAVLNSVKFPKTTTVIGLAKKEEVIITAKFDEKNKLKFEEIHLADNSPAQHLVQRLRDEAHRFANRLREKTADKKMKES